MALSWVQADARSCELPTQDAAWLTSTIDRWESVRKSDLKQKTSFLPWMVLFDESCIYHINPDPKVFAIGKAAGTVLLKREDLRAYSLPHTGMVDLPDGAKVPARLLSFAANYDSDRGSFLAAALPSIWRKAEHLKDEADLEALVRSVYIHELTHTFHRRYFSRLSVLEKELEGVENFDDDIVQRTFEKNEAFRTAYLREIELAKTAIAEPDKKKRVALARDLASAIRKRRDTFYTGSNGVFAEIEDIFLMMEGVANWAAYRSAIADGLKPAEASKLVRRSGKWWSQEQGILLFMLIDSLSNNWQVDAFDARPITALDLLMRSAR